MIQPNPNLKAEEIHDTPLSPPSSRNPEVQKILQQAERISRYDVSVLLLGPSGSGKTRMAQEIHKMSHRSEKPFVTVHCPSLSEKLLESELFGHVEGAFTGACKDYFGKVKAAEGGTLFFDEIGEISTLLQAKLLQLLQDGTYERVGENKTRKADIRVIASTNRDIHEACKKGEFREDLKYRLNVIEFNMPALADCNEDIVPLAEYFLNRNRQSSVTNKIQLSRESKDHILKYDWPGNIRELENAMERCSVLCEGTVIEKDALRLGLGIGNYQRPES